MSKPRFQTHHMLWERKEWNASPIGRRLRNDPMFKLELVAPVHRLLHVEHDPIPLPDEYLLDDMMRYKHLGMTGLIDCLDDPIANHLDQQMYYLDLSPSQAFRQLRRLGHDTRV
jgi:hypothetical protein